MGRTLQVSSATCVVCCYVPTFGNTKLLLLLLSFVLVFRAKNDGYNLSLLAPLPLDVLIVLYSCWFGYF